MISSASQSLFQIYYLGEVAVDRRVSKCVLPWITEEKKLMVEGMHFIWLTPGADGLSYVADNGQEIFSHHYSSIVQSALSTDDTSFAYIAHRATDGKYYCHVFQALTCEEAALIMQKIRANTTDLPASKKATKPLKLPKSAKMSAALKKKLSCEYVVDYIGKTETQSPSLTKETQVQVLDNAVKALKDKYALLSKQNKDISSRLKSKMTRKSSKSSGVNVDELSTTVDEEDAGKRNGDGVAITLSRTSQSPDELLGDPPPLSAASVAALATTSEREISHQSSTEDDNTTTSKVTVSVKIGGFSQEEQMEVEEHRLPTPISDDQRQSPPHHPPTESSTPNSHDDSKPPSSHSSEGGAHTSQSQHLNGQSEADDALSGQHKTTSGSPGLEGEVEHRDVRNDEAAISSLKEAAIGSVKEPEDEEEEEEGEEEEEEEREGEGERTASESSDFDTIPELDSLQSSVEFKALSQKSLEVPLRRVTMVFSGLSLSVLSESGQQLFKRKIKSIACCAQGRRWSEYISFTCREGEAKPRNYFLYMFKAESSKYANMILESFKACFTHGLSLSPPMALCEFCPLLKLHDLCRSLEGVSSQVAQSRIHDVLATFKDSHYKNIMRQLKASQHADQEFTELVMLVALLRAHYQRLQDQHSHSTMSPPVEKPPTASSTAATSTTVGEEEGKSRLRVPAFTRAKNAITSSFENLRADKKQKLKKSATLDSEPDGDGGKKQDADRTTQSLTLPRSSSPSFFSRKVAATTVLSLTPPDEDESAEGSKKDTEVKRERSWSASFRLRRPKSPRSTEASDEEATKKTATESQPTPPPSGDALADKQDPPPPPPPAPAKAASPPPLPIQPLSPPVSATPQSRSSREEIHTPTRPLWKHKSARPDRRRRKTSPRALTPDNNFVAMLPKGFTPGHRRSTSWMQEIFDSINTPTKKERTERFSKGSMEFLDDFEVIEPPSIDQLSGTKERVPRESSREEEQSPRTRAKQRWRSAIDQQIILNRMDRINKQFTKESSEADLKRLKLCYHDPTLLDPAEAGRMWTEITAAQQPPEKGDIQQALLIGVPPGKRGEVWSHLADLYQTRRKSSDATDLADGPPEPYELLRLGSTEYEHSIAVDLGRTFPSHPYFSGRFKQLGQQALYNVLHAYAVADPETGYCQGLSFVVGMLIMHTKDDEAAFAIMHQFMTLYNYREIYCPSLTNLQLRLYQFSRLMNDQTPAIYHHLVQCEVTPFFYAAPWFLTVFASQYPIAFTARVLDMFFYEGPDIIFKVSLAMMKFHSEGLLRCRTMEATSTYLKTQLPETILQHMPAILKDALEMNFGNRLLSFETEYEMMEELTSSFRMDLSMTDIESVNEVMKQQNTALREQLAICHGSIRNLDAMIGSMQEELVKQKEVMDAQQQQIEKQQRTIMRLDEMFSAFQLQSQQVPFSQPPAVD